MSTLLATTTPGGFAVIRDAFQRMDILNRPDELLEALSGMPFILASVIVVVGALCVLNGYRWHKWVIVSLAFFAGLGLGHLLSVYVGKSAIVAISLGLLCAIISTPMMKVTVAVFGGITGAFIGANIWSAIYGAPASGSAIAGTESHWIGAMMGFIIIAMASLILFRLVIVLFTSVGGAAMVVFGAITLLLHVPAWEPAVKASLTANPVILPLLLTVAAVAGFVLQQSRVKEEQPDAAKH